MALKLYGVPFSGNNARVLLTLYEKAVDNFEFVEVDMRHGAHKGDEFKAMQPFGQVPVLRDGSLTLFESRAIARYLANKYEGQGTPLFGSTPRDRALVDVWLEVESQNFHPPASGITVEKAAPLFLGRQSDESVIETNLGKLGKVLDIYNAHLSKNKYLAGDFFSLADLTHICTLNHPLLSDVRAQLLEGRPHVEAWIDEISARLSWTKVFAFMQESMAASEA